MGKIGRNDLCPCGSGKKYKKCCLPLERKIGPLQNVGDLLDYAADWIMSCERLKTEFEILKRTYSSRTDFELNEKLGLCLRNMFMFDYKLKDHYDMSPFRYFVQQANLPPRYKEVYQDFCRNKLNFFRVTDIDRHNQGIAVEDVITDEIVPLYVKNGETDCYVDDIILSRIAPYRNGFVSLTPITDSFYLSFGSLLDQYFYKYPADRRKGHILGFDVLDFFYKKDKNSETVDEAKKALKEKLTNIGLSIDFRTLSARINGNQSLEEAFPEIINFEFLTNRDHHETRTLLQQVWDNYPRKDLDGKTMIETYPVGPTEQSLINEFDLTVDQEFKPESYASLDKVRVAFNPFREEWLDTQLSGIIEEKTPRQLILEEREQLNNPSEKIDLEIEIEPERDYDRNLAEKLNKEGLTMFNKGTLIGAADRFRQITNMYPSFHHAWGNLGSCYARLGQKDQAEFYFKKALFIQPDYEFAKQGLAFIENNTEEALAMYGVAGALLGGMHEMSGSKKKSDEGPINVWREMDKKFEEIKDEQKG